MVNPSDAYSDIGDFGAGEAGWWFGKPEADHPGLQQKLSDLGVEVIHRGTTPPESSEYAPEAGAAYYNETSEVLHVGDGTAWNAQATWGENPSFAAVDTERVSSKRFAPTGATAADIQALVDTIAAETSPHNHGVVYGRGDTVYDIDQTLSLKSNVYLRDMLLRQADGANLNAVVETQDFDTLSGTGFGAISDGVPYHFGLVNVSIDGNKANNTSGDGVHLYGKSTYADALHIYNCTGVGWLSEMGKGYDNNTPESINDTYIGNVFVNNCGGNGFVYRGPHDAIVHKVVVSKCAGNGIVVENANNGSTGGTRFGMLHPWGNDGNFRIDAPINANELYADGDPLYITGKVHVAHIRSLFDAGVNIQANESKIGSINVIGNNGASNGPNDGVVITGAGTTVESIQVRDHDADGVVVEANNVSISNVVCNDNTGRGLVVGETSGVNDCKISATDLDRNGTSAFYYGSGNDDNSFDISSFIGTGYVGLDSTSALASDRDKFDVDFHGSGTGTGVSKERLRFVSMTGDGTTRFTTPHNLLAKPKTVNIQARDPNALSGAPIMWAFGGTDASNIAFEFATAPPSGVNFDVCIDATIGGRQ